MHEKGTLFVPLADEGTPGTHSFSPSLTPPTPCHDACAGDWETTKRNGGGNAMCLKIPPLETRLRTSFIPRLWNGVPRGVYRASLIYRTHPALISCRGSWPRANAREQTCSPPCRVWTVATPDILHAALTLQARLIPQAVHVQAYTRQKAKSKHRNRIRLERASQKESSDTHKTPYDRVKQCREHKINIKASERANVDVFTQNKRPCPQHSQTPIFKNIKRASDRKNPIWLGARFPLGRLADGLRQREDSSRRGQCLRTPARLPPRRTEFNPRPGHRIFASGNRGWSAGFLGIFRFPRPLIPAPLHIHFNLSVKEPPKSLHPLWYEILLNDLQEIGNEQQLAYTVEDCVGKRQVRERQIVGCAPEVVNRTARERRPYTHPHTHSRSRKIEANISIQSTLRMFPKTNELPLVAADANLQIRTFLALSSHCDVSARSICAFFLVQAMREIVRKWNDVVGATMRLYEGIGTTSLRMFGIVKIGNGTRLELLQRRGFPKQCDRPAFYMQPCSSSTYRIFLRLVQARLDRV
ncbi:hypothetical protein PR048_025883 [Dryococelus australis]|uniref:Uncharacterized protein n=1 Tax=Dryococelus australis TaxID=614101 RepID=A0ABQ9GJS9_9NEOP|nr:hypothetical protein PR048_025883 [Dryococelus australis]